MGLSLSKFNIFKKSASPSEELESVQKDIDSVQSRTRQAVFSQNRWLGTLFLYSSVAYVLMAVALYFFWPKETRGKVIASAPLLLIPVVLLGLRYLVRIFYRQRILGHQSRLEALLVRKKELIELIKEKEPYRRAKEILERLGIEQPLPTPGKPNSPPNTAADGVRRRGPGPAPPGPGGGPALGPPPLPRPLLPAPSGTMDRLLAAVLGDGAPNRMALICGKCHRHNGMALVEEFDYLSYHCAFCGTLHPARKRRENAPPVADRNHDASTSAPGAPPVPSATAVPSATPGLTPRPTSPATPSDPRAKADKDAVSPAPVSSAASKTIESAESDSL